jgi:hypothetical protein
MKLLLILVLTFLISCAQPVEFSTITQPVIQYCTKQCQNYGRTLDFIVIYPNDQGDMCQCN